MTNDELKQIIYTWFVKASGLDPIAVIFANQRGDQPDPPYGTINILSGPKILGDDEERQPDVGDTSSDVNICGQRRMLFSLNIFSNLDPQRPGGINKPGALQRMSDVLSSLELPSVFQSLNGQGVTINDRGEVQNLTALLETDWQERSQLDVTFGYASNIGDQPGSIDTVDFGGGLITGTIDPAGITTPNVEVTKP